MEGFWMFAPQSQVCWEFHTVMPLSRECGDAMREMWKGWIWKELGCQRLVTNIPESNKIAHRFGQRIGLIEFGRNPLSYLKDGKLEGQILMGISEGALCR
jgi:RimJ/RimL family protein N-acetyltransferase